jgi:hypothetical protein
MTEDFRIEIEEDVLSISCDADCNVIEIWNEDVKRWNNIILTDIQIKELIKFLQKNTVGTKESE